MVLGFLLYSIKTRSLKCRFEHSNPFIRPKEGPEFEERKKYREKLLAIWVNSVADDFDLLTDWWFTYKCFVLHGIDVSGGMYAQATLYLQ